MKEALLPLLFAAVISFALTPLCKRIAAAIGAIDIPKDERRMHSIPIPRLGGLAIYIAVIIVTLLFSSNSKSILCMIAGATVIMISGVIDDSKGLTPRQKILFQFAAAILAVVGGVKIDFISNPFSAQNALMYLSYIGIPITIFWIIGITNTINLIDGLDGLSAGISMISALSLMVIAFIFGRTDIVIIAAAIAGACLGFLPFNFNPASIFMGDTGALFLGFMLASISIEGVIKSAAAVALLAPIIILGIPIFDTTFAIIRRLASGRSISEADKGHLHHRLIKMGNTQKRTVLILYAVSALFGGSSVIITLIDSIKGVYFSFLILFIAIVLALMLGLLTKNE